jgi:hypothetical protein
MRTPCASGHDGGREGRSGRSVAGRQQLHLEVDIEAHPLLELAAARLLILATDELRGDGFVICGLRVAVEG